MTSYADQYMNHLSGRKVLSYYINGIHYRPGDRVFDPATNTYGTVADSVCDGPDGYPYHIPISWDGDLGECWDDARQLRKVEK